MAIRRRRHKHGPEGRKQHADELSARLAPLEELKPELDAPPAQTDNGKYGDATITVGSKSVKVPEKFLGGGENREGLSVFRPDTVVVVILAVMLAFIAFVTCQITLMPPAR